MGNEQLTSLFCLRRIAWRISGGAFRTLLGNGTGFSFGDEEDAPSTSSSQRCSAMLVYIV